MAVKVTHHGMQRIKDRVGLSKKIADKLAEKVLCNGIKHCDTKGSIKKFLDALYFSHEKANNIHIYNQKIYLFRNEILITVLDLPSKYINMIEKTKHKKENRGET